MVQHAFLLAMAFFIGGCASYRYDISTADTPPREVKSDSDLVIPPAPVEFRLRQVESRCVFMIENRGQTPVTLDGVASAIVDPNAQSRAVATQLIPPGAFVKLVLPPLQEVEPRGPELRIGFGMQVRANSAQEESSNALYMLYGPQTQEYWDWSGESSITLLLALKHDEKTDRHQFVIRRMKQ